MSDMAYKKLSEVVMELEQPQQSDKFVKMFRDAVRDGEIDALDLKERFTMPKQYQRRGQEGSYTRDTRDMIFLETDKSSKWIEQASAALSQVMPRGGRGKVKPSIEALEAGELDFKELVEQTRRSMQAKHARGQQLGNSRKTTKSKKK